MTQVTISVYCNDVSHKKGKVADVASFTSFDYAPPTQAWHVRLGHWQNPTRSRIDVLDEHDEPLLSGDQVGRSRYRLECDLCGFPVVVRAEKLFPMLDCLAEDSVMAISLRGLAARLVSRPKG